MWKLLVLVVVAVATACSAQSPDAARTGATSTTDLRSTDSMGDASSEPGDPGLSGPRGSSPPSKPSPKQAAAPRSIPSDPVLASVGRYRYTVDEDGVPRGFASLAVSPTADDDVVHSLVVEMDEPLRREFTLVSTADGAVAIARYRESLDADSTVVCDWSVPLVVVPADPAVGKTWTSHSTCSFTRRGRSGQYTRDETGTVAAVETVQAAGREWPVYVMRIEGTNRTTGTDDSQRRYTVEHAVTAAGLTVRSVETAEASIVNGPTVARWKRTLRLDEVVD